MNILIINAGSSSLKYQLINMESETIITRGLCERIGLENSLITYTTDNIRYIKKSVCLKDHVEAFYSIKDILLDKENGVISSLSEIAAVGHRVVHGGPIFKHPTIIDKDVIDKIESLIPLAPLHNKAHVDAMNACFKVFGNSVPEVAVFDTSFYSNMPQKSYIYSIPYEYYEKYRIRKYGFHGISHSYASKRYCEITGKDIKSLKIITCHLGNGSSVTAIKNGEAVDTSMGLTPLEGLTMGTRSGTIDPSIIIFLQQKHGFTVDRINKVLNKESGLLGISGISSDIRDLTVAERNGNNRAKLAQSIFKYQVIKHIGSYIAVMNGVDAIIFTAGIGENQISYREDICASLSYTGLFIDKNLNSKTFDGKESRISTDDSNVDVFVIPTNEELSIARETLSTIKNSEKLDL